MKTILKCLAWIAAMLAVTLAVVYGLWLILIFFLFGETLLMAAAIAGELALFGIYFWLIRIAEC